MKPTTGIADVFHGDADSILKRGVSLKDAIFQASLTSGLVMLIAKSTEGGKRAGKPYVDPRWHEWADGCREANLMLASRGQRPVIFGTFHFLTDSAPGEEQAEFCAEELKAAGFDPALIFVAADKERNPGHGGTATVIDANAFERHWFDLYSRYPWHYSNTSDYARDIKNPDATVVKLCPWWAAAYGNDAPGPAGSKLWQYMGVECTESWEFPSNQLFYPRSFLGLGKVDRSAFNGTVDELHDLVANAGRLAEP